MAKTWSLSSNKNATFEVVCVRKTLLANIEAPPPGVHRRSPVPESNQLLNDPTFRQLVTERTSFARTLSILMLAVYLIFVFLVAFDKPLMATTLLGGVTSLGIVLGLFVIIFAFALTGIYIRRVNSVFDRLSEEVRRQAR